MFRSRALDTIPLALLKVGVYGYALSLLMGRGTYEPALMICAIAVPLCLLQVDARAALHGPLSWVLAGGVAFLLPGMLMAGKAMAGDFHWAITCCLLAVTAITILSRGRPPPQPVVAVTCLLMVFVVFHLAGNAWGPQNNKVGLSGAFDNIHYMALYAVMTIPVLMWLVLQVRGRVCALLTGSLLADVGLLLQSHSRPGYLAMIAAAAAFVLSASPRMRWSAGIGLLVLLAALYASGLFEFSARIDDFLNHLDQEERTVIWREFVRLQLRSTDLQWVFGHGLGQYFWDYQGISSFHDLPHGMNRDFSSPHNHLLDVLYSTGVWGVVIFLLVYSTWFTAMVRTMCMRGGIEKHGMGRMLLCVMVAHLVMSFFTIPFFSRHNLYPLSLVLGASMIYLQAGRHHG